MQSHTDTQKHIFFKNLKFKKCQFIFERKRDFYWTLKENCKENIMCILWIHHLSIKKPRFGQEIEVGHSGGERILVEKEVGKCTMKL